MVGETASTCAAAELAGKQMRCVRVGSGKGNLEVQAQATVVPRIRELDMFEHVRSADTD